jgi:hypothetical protein
VGQGRRLLECDHAPAERKKTLQSQLLNQVTKPVTGRDRNDPPDPRDVPEMFCPET